MVQLKLLISFYLQSILSSFNSCMVQLKLIFAAIAVISVIAF